MFLSVPILSVAQKTELVIYTGPNLSSLRGNDVLNDYHNAKIGLSTGMGINRHFPGKLSIAFSLVYEEKGSQGDIEVLVTYNSFEQLTSTPFKTKYNYLSLPFTMRYTLGDKVKFNAEIGAYSAYLIRAIAEFDASVIMPAMNENVTSSHKDFDFGVVFGLGASIPVNERISIFTSFRENLGLRNISDLPIANDGAIRTSSFNLLFGLNYKLK